MRCRSRILTCALCGFLSFAVAAPFVKLAAAQHTKADDRWVFSHFREVLTSLLPIDKGEDEYIGYRVAYDYSVGAPDYSFVIEHTPLSGRQRSQDVVRAHVRMADAKSIYQQMLELHESHPGGGAAAVEKGIRLRTWNLSEAKCPAIRARFDAFQEIHFKPPRLSTVIMDAPTYEIGARSGTGSMKLSLDDSDDPAVVWANETARAFAECGADTKAPIRAAP